MTKQNLVNTCPRPVSAEIDTAAFSVSSMFHPNNKALDIFGDKDTSDARRRCQPDQDDAEGQLLFDLHLGVSIIYAAVYGGYLAMPYCADVLEGLLDERGHPLSLLLLDGDSGQSPSTTMSNTPRVYSPCSLTLSKVTVRRSRFRSLFISVPEQLNRATVAINVLCDPL